MTRTFTAVIHQEDEWYVADCPEVGTVSQGKTVEEAVANLKEATELYLEEFPLEKEWSRLSLASAMRGMEDEADHYTLADLKVEYL